MALELHHCFDDLLRSKRKTDAPTSHCIRLRERPGDYDLVFGARHRGDRERLALVDELTVAFVGQQIDLAARRELKDLLEFANVEHRAARVVRRIDDDELRAFR